jgi:hypothetical protein
MKLELFKRQPKTFFLVANGFLGINEFLLLHSDPLLVKSDTILEIGEVTMEVLQKEYLVLMGGSCSIKFLA